MKVELQCGDTITIPNGCKAIVKDGSVVFEKEEKEFKDGDVLVSVRNGHRYNAFIYESTSEMGSHFYYVGLDACNQISISTPQNHIWSNCELAHATEEEKQLLLDKMKEQGLRWNVEEKRVEKIRWRAKIEEKYYFLDSCLVKVCVHELYDMLDEKFWSNFNYFRTEEQAQEAAKRIIETLRKYHEEIGE